MALLQSTDCLCRLTLIDLIQRRLSLFGSRMIWVDSVENGTSVPVSTEKKVGRGLGLQLTLRGCVHALAYVGYVRVRIGSGRFGTVALPSMRMVFKHGSLRCASTTATSRNITRYNLMIYRELQLNTVA